MKKSLMIYFVMFIFILNGIVGCDSSSSSLTDIQKYTYNFVNQTSETIKITVLNIVYYISPNSTKTIETSETFSSFLYTPSRKIVVTWVEFQITFSNLPLTILSIGESIVQKDISITFSDVFYGRIENGNIGYTPESKRLVGIKITFKNNSTSEFHVDPYDFLGLKLGTSQEGYTSLYNVYDNNTVLIPDDYRRSKDMATGTIFNLYIVFIEPIGPGTEYELLLKSSGLDIANNFNFKMIFMGTDIK